MKTCVGDCVPSLFRTSTLTFPPSQLIPNLLFSGSSPSCTVAMWHLASLYFRTPLLTRRLPELAAWCAASHGTCLGLLCALTKQHRKRLQHGCDASKRTQRQCWKCVLWFTGAVQVGMCAGQCIASGACCKSWGNLLMGLFSRSKTELKRSCNNALVSKGKWG